MTYSYFDASLRCRHCSHERVVSITTRVESELGTVLRIGSSFEATTVDMESSHRTVREPEVGAPIRVVEAWDCSSCTSPQWAEIVASDGTIVSIDAFDLTPEILDRVHYISDAVDELYEQRTGESIFTVDSLRPDWVDRLRATLQVSSAP